MDTTKLQALATTLGAAPTISPFPVIVLGHGNLRIGDSLHDGRLPALWFGRGGLGLGDEQIMDRYATDGETLAVVTFENVQGLDVLVEVLQRIRRDSFPAAPVATVESQRAVISELEDQIATLEYSHFDGFLPAAAPAPAQANGWLPIATAPKDGRTMLLGYFNQMGKWRTMRGQWFTKAEIDEDWEEPEDFEEGWYETAVEPDCPNCWPIAPTHYQPLPPPPDAAIQAQGSDAA